MDQPYLYLNWLHIKLRFFLVLFLVFCFFFFWKMQTFFFLLNWVIMLEFKIIPIKGNGGGKSAKWWNKCKQISFGTWAWRTWARSTWAHGLESGRMFHSEQAVPCIMDQIPRNPLCSCEGSGVLVVPTSWVAHWVLVLGEDGDKASS